MKLKTLIYLISIPILLFQCDASKQTLSKNSKMSPPPNGKPGSYYAKCYMPDQSTSNSKFIAVYTGDETTEKVNIENKEITLKPASTKWEKKPSDRKCLSDDPNDCLVWCLVDIPAETVSYKIIKDTSQSANYEMKEVKQEVLTKKGGYTEWKETLCNKQVTDNVYKQIKMGLVENGFLEADISGEISSGFNSEVKSALTKFQKATGLPVGQLDLETMAALEVEY